MKILVTGANGMLARAAIKYCNFIGDDVAAFSRAELDIADAEAVTATIADVRPDVIMNCAAYTNVDGAETNEAACYAANSDGVENLAAAARSVNAVFVTVSTDYVFDGTNPGFYTQRDTPKPQGVYAASKREGEVRSFSVYPRSIIVRSGWIYGHGGTNFLSVMPTLLAEGKSMNAIRDSNGTPTFANDLAKRLRELAEADLPGVYHITNAGEGTSYFGFAEKICEFGGFDKALLQPTPHTELKRPAPRPVNSRLACLISEKLGFEPMRNWEDALAEFIVRD